MYRFLSHYYEMLFPYRQYVAWKDFARPMLRRSRAVRSFKDRGERPLVIDAGCGTGALADLLATYYDVIGIDISEEMLDQALKNYPDRGILWVRQDIAKMETGRPTHGRPVSENTPGNRIRSRNSAQNSSCRTHTAHWRTPQIHHASGASENTDSLRTARHSYRIRRPFQTKRTGSP